MRKYFLFIFFLIASILANAQDFKYFVLDTVSARIIMMTGKNEIPWPLPSGSMWHWQKERQLIKNVEEHVFKVAFQDVDWIETVGGFKEFTGSDYADYAMFCRNWNYLSYPGTYNSSIEPKLLKYYFPKRIPEP